MAARREADGEGPDLVRLVGLDRGGEVGPAVEGEQVFAPTTSRRPGNRGRPPPGGVDRMVEWVWPSRTASAAGEQVGDETGVGVQRRRWRATPPSGAREAIGVDGDRRALVREAEPGGAQPLHLEAGG